MEFLGNQTIFSREAREEREESIGNLFLWSVVIVAMLGLNAFSWIFCMYVFGNPEVPFNYKLLTKLEKLDPVTGFEPVTAPRGRFNTARSLYLESFDTPPKRLDAYNGILKRFYLKNYHERDDVTFLSGSFLVLASRELRPEDVFPRGVAVRLQADDLPAAQVDLVFPVAEGALVPSEHFRPGDQVQIQQSSTCAAVLHVHRMENDLLCFTAVPLVKRDYETPAGTVLAVAPPERLNLETGRWPMSDDGIVATPVDTGDGDASEEGDAEGADEAPPAEG